VQDPAFSSPTACARVSPPTLWEAQGLYSSLNRRLRSSTQGLRGAPCEWPWTQVHAQGPLCRTLGPAHLPPAPGTLRRALGLGYPAPAPGPLYRGSTWVDPLCRALRSILGHGSIGAGHLQSLYRYLSTHACIHTYIHTSIYIYIYTHICVNIYISVSIYTCIIYNFAERWVLDMYTSIICIHVHI